MTYESSREMTADEQNAFDLGYKNGEADAREAAAKMLEAEADKIMGTRIYNITRAGALRSAAGMIRQMGRARREEGS